MSALTQTGRIPGGNCAGFTLVEMLVSLAIVSIILVAVTSVFERSGRLYTTQNATAALQQELRAALDVIVTEARAAAYDPKKTEDFAIKTATSTIFRFRSDLNGDGELGKKATKSPYNGDNECEDRTFRFSLSKNSIQIVCGTGSAPGDTETLIGGDSNVKITALDFSYRDKKNATTTIISEIRGAVVTITGQAPAGRDGMITRSYKTVVEFRNAGTNTW